MRCFCFWSPFMTVRPWSRLNRGNFCLKTVVSRQLSVLEVRSPQLHWLTPCHFAKSASCSECSDRLEKSVCQWMDEWMNCEQGTVNVCFWCDVTRKKTTQNPLVPGNVWPLTCWPNNNCLCVQFCVIRGSPFIITSQVLLTWCFCCLMPFFWF